MNRVTVGAAAKAGTGPMPTTAPTIVAPPPPLNVVSGGNVLVESGDGQATQVAVLDLGDAQPRTFSIYTRAMITETGAPAMPPPTYSVQLAVTFGRRGGAITRTIPAGRQFLLSASRIEITARLMRGFPGPPNGLQKGVCTAQVQALICDGDGASAMPPTIWINPHGGAGAPLKADGVIAFQTPCVLYGASGFNGGAALRYLMLLDSPNVVTTAGEDQRYPELVQPVPAGGSFSWDLAPTGRIFHRGCTWGASTTPTFFTADAGALFRLDAEIAL